MIPALIITVIIVALSLVPSPVPMSTGHLDKAAHFIMYGAAAWTYLRATRYMMTAVVLCALLGIILETVQHFLGWRSFSFGDIVANCAGIAAAAFIWAGRRTPKEKAGLR